jgi:hypothetical protein
MLGMGEISRFLNRSYEIEAILVVALTVLLMYPIFQYIFIGWRNNRQAIMSIIDDQAKITYLKKIRKLSEDINKRNVKNIFDKFYTKKFGRRRFVVPTVIMFVVIVILSSIEVEFFIKGENFVWKPTLSINGVAAAALAGAYMWVIGDFISRARRLDFSPADVSSGSLRLVIAAAVGLSFGSIVKDDVGAFIAFGLGAFPLGTIQIILRQLSYKKLGIEIGPVETNNLLSLDGVDKQLIERLSNEDINSVAQLAYYDPIWLTMSSNLTFNAVVDLVSQALAWVYVGEKLSLLRPLGIRGAYEFKTLFECVSLDDLEDPKNKESAMKLLPVIAETLGRKVEEVDFLLREIALDPYTDFIYAVWS